MRDYILIRDLNYIIVPVSEEVEKSNLKKFILTQLALNDISLHKDMQLFYTYIKPMKSYQISYYFKKETALPFFCYVDEMSSSITLFIDKIYFVLFNQGKLYYYKKFDVSVSPEDCLLFIEKQFKINREELKIDKKLSFSNDRENMSILTFINPRTSYKQLIQYGLFLFLLLGLFLIFYFEKKERLSFEDNSYFKKLQQRYIVLKKEKTKKMEMASVLANLFNSLHKRSLRLRELSFRNELFVLRIESDDKKSLYHFLDDYKYTLVVKKVFFDKRNNQYVLEASFRKD